MLKGLPLVPSLIPQWIKKFSIPTSTAADFLSSCFRRGRLHLRGWYRLKGVLYLPACEIVGSGVIVADLIRIEGNLTKGASQRLPSTLISLEGPIGFSDEVHSLDAFLVSCSGKQTLPDEPFFLRGGLAVQQLNVERLSIGGRRDIEYDLRLKERP